MTKRTTAELLSTVAEDIAAMANVAHDLDNLASSLDLRNVDAQMSRDLQRVDALFQHLDDMASLLHRMSELIGEGPELDIRDLSNSVRLDYVKARLADGRPVSPFAPIAGDVNLF